MEDTGEPERMNDDGVAEGKAVDGEAGGKDDGAGTEEAKDMKDETKDDDTGSDKAKDVKSEPGDNSTGSDKAKVKDGGKKPGEETPPARAV